MATLVTIQGPIIKPNQALSDPIDCSAGRIVRITTPVQWDLANLSFQISTDGNQYADLHLPRTGEVVLACGANRAFAINSSIWPAARFVKFRSGSAGEPIAQKAQRKFETVIDTSPP